MISEPSLLVLYVNEMAKTSQFYQELFGIKPMIDSDSFHSFKFTNGMCLSLKAKHTVIPPTDQMSGNGELAFTLDSKQAVDDLFTTMQAKEINIVAPPMQVPYGYTFVASDPDGFRLRVVSLGNS